ncbi:MAG TPA: hypothetical protein VFU00_13640, partial [Gemmatimonadales bacterium]|nr:hypothetical protein [Gemmatimonadales bacterium]
MIPLRSRLARGVGALALLGAVAGAAAAGLARRDDFDHELHRKLFTSCEGCHAGVRTDATPWPDPAECATCHDGEIEERTDWAPPELPRTNLRFSHPEHFREVREEKPAIADSAEQCATCHIPAGGEWMQVHLAQAEQCLDCHELPSRHFAVEDTRCAECHVPLPEATRLLAADVAEFPEPPSHEDSAFITEHGTLAEAGPGDVPFSCSTCHARDFCAQCHV